MIFNQSRLIRGVAAGAALAAFVALPQVADAQSNAPVQRGWEGSQTAQAQGGSAQGQGGAQSGTEQGGQNRQVQPNMAPGMTGSGTVGTTGSVLPPGTQVPTTGSRAGRGDGQNGMGAMGSGGPNQGGNATGSQGGQGGQGNQGGTTR